MTHLQFLALAFGAFFIVVFGMVLYSVGDESLTRPMLVQALASHGFVAGNQIEIGGPRFYLERVSVVARGNGEFNVNFKAGPAP